MSVAGKLTSMQWGIGVCSNELASALGSRTQLLTPHCSWQKRRMLVAVYALDCGLLSAHVVLEASHLCRRVGSLAWTWERSRL